MNINVKSSHTLCERIRIFLRKPTLETLIGIWRNCYVKITEEERNCILNNKIYTSKASNDEIKKRQISVKSLDEGVSVTRDDTPIVTNLNNNNEISKDEEESNDDSDRNNFSDKECPASNIKEEEIIFNSNGRSGEEEKENNNDERESSGNEEINKNIAEATETRKEQSDQECNKTNHVCIEKAKFNQGYVLSQDLIVREDFLKPGMKYYDLDTLEKKFVVKSADQDWCDKQVELEYKILLNSEVDTVLNDNLKFAQKQQANQEDCDAFNHALLLKHLDPETHIIVEEHDARSGAASAKGHRPKMEDTHIMDTTYGVFDGHGGTAMSMHLESDMHNAICNELGRWRKADNKIDCDGSCVPMNEKARNVNALMMAHQKVNVENVTKDMNYKAGSTSVLANLIDNDLYISNLGDSRAILIAPDGTVVQMTEDAKNFDYVNGNHVANRHTHDVLERGGLIEIFANNEIVSTFDLDYAQRVNGVLGIPKAHGDRQYSSLDVGGIMAFSKRPEITLFEKPIDGWAGYKLLLCCDGLTDVASTKQIGEYVHKETHSEKNTSYKDIASKLVTVAYDAKSLDNITVMLFDVDQMKATY